MFALHWQLFDSEEWSHFYGPLQELAVKIAELDEKCWLSS